MSDDHIAQLTTLVEAAQHTFRQNAKEMSIRYRCLVSEVKKGKAEYTVDVLTYWPEGEENVTITSRASLDAVLAKADMEFDTVNKRKDAQRKYSVRVSYDGLKVPLPEEMYASYVAGRKESVAKGDDAIIQFYLTRLNGAAASAQK